MSRCAQNQARGGCVTTSVQRNSPRYCIPIQDCSVTVIRPVITLGSGKSAEKAITYQSSECAGFDLNSKVDKFPIETSEHTSMCQKGRQNFGRKEACLFFRNKSSKNPDIT